MTNEERQRAIEWMKGRPVMMAGAKRMYDLAVEALEAYEQGKADAAHTIKDKTLFIKVSDEDVDRIKRVMLDCDPWCKTFYEDAPGEAHWIKKYTPDDGEIYECDHCGVEWQFNDGGPEENEAFFCPKCGFKMERCEADGKN